MQLLTILSKLQINYSPEILLYISILLYSRAISEIKGIDKGYKPINLRTQSESGSVHNKIFLHLMNTERAIQNSEKS